MNISSINSFATSQQMAPPNPLQYAQGNNLAEKLDSVEQSKASELKYKDGGFCPNLSAPLTDSQESVVQSDMDDIMLSSLSQSFMTQINGTEGNDTIKATPNKDGSLTIDVNGQTKTYTKEEVANGFIINTGDGNDKIDVSASDANFIINSGEGNNTVSLGTGRNILTTGSGNNTITGNDAKRTSIETGSGDNNITLGKSANKVVTNGGTNTITASQGSLNDIVAKFADGKTTTINLDTDKSNYITTTGTANITLGNGDNNIESYSGNINITAGDGNNTIIGGKQANTITVGNGNNYISGGLESDTIKAGDGNNTIYGLDGGNEITAGNGNNYIDGGAGNDTIVAGTGKNIVIGGLGEDKITVAGTGGTIIDDSDGSNITGGEGNNVKLYNSSETSFLGQSFKVAGTELFQARMKSDLETFRATKSGQKLLSEIDKSGKQVLVEQTNELNGFAGPMMPGDGIKGKVTPDGQRGEGTDSRIFINPSFLGPANGLPINTFFHEGVHAYNNVTGTMQTEQMFDTDPETGMRGIVSLAEFQAVGLDIISGTKVEHPDGTVTAGNPEGLSENSIREELGLPRRNSYLGH
ncbi:hypothetical protein IJJ97_01480 [bacterium]|nr:hypothetical protein [bacterium]